MEKKALTRRKMILGAMAALPAVAVSSLALGSERNATSGLGKVADQWSRNSAKAGSVSIQVESLDSSVGLAQSVDLVNAHFSEVMHIARSSRVPSPYYFAVDVDRKRSRQADWGITINLFEADGSDIGSITTTGGSTAVFADQKLRFRIGTDAH